MKRLIKMVVVLALVLGTGATPAFAEMMMPMMPMPMPGSTTTTMAPMPGSTTTTMAPMPGSSSGTPMTTMPNGMMMDMDMMTMMMDQTNMAMVMDPANMAAMMDSSQMAMMMDSMMPMAPTDPSMTAAPMTMMSLAVASTTMTMPMPGTTTTDTTTPSNTTTMAPMPGSTTATMTPMPNGMMMDMDMMTMMMDPTNMAMVMDAGNMAAMMDPSMMTMMMDSMMPMDMPMDPSMTMDPSMPASPSTPMDPSMPMPTTGTTASTMAGMVRTSSSDRVSASVSVSKSAFETGTADYAVLVNGYSTTDSLAAPSLAGALDAPILLSTASGVSEKVINELDRLGVTRVYLVGGTKSLSASVVADLTDSGFRVTRVGGDSAYATAAAVARKVASIRGSIERAFVVDVSDAGAAIAAAPYAYSQGFPILFTSANGVPAATFQAIRDSKIHNVTVVGATSSVSAKSYSALSKATAGGSDYRIAGTSRFDTARKLADKAISKGWAEAAHVGVVNGTKSFGEALVGAASIGAQGGVVVLSTTTDLPRPSELFLTQHNSTKEIDVIHMFGGTAVLSDAVMNDVMSTGMSSGMDMDNMDMGGMTGGTTTGTDAHVH